MHRPTVARLNPGAFVKAVSASAIAATLPVGPLELPAASPPPALVARALGGYRASAAPQRATEAGAAASTSPTALTQGEIPADEESSNWSGYEETGPGAHFTEVAAGWTVPKLEADDVTGYSSTWVGVDGTGTPDLIQAGTEQDSTTSGPVYYAWYELLPGSAVDLGDVHPGDKVTASIAQALPNKWLISVADTTSGKAWDQQVSYTAVADSVEWIVEAPTSTASKTVEPLAAFGSVTFSNLSVRGTNIADLTASPVYLLHPGDGLVEAYPGPYIAATGSFTDYFGSPTGALVTAPAKIAVRVATAAASSQQLPPGNGYWLAGPDGEVAAFGDASRFGKPSKLNLREPVVAVVPAAGYRGYWLVARDGGVFGFGAAPYLGSLPALAKDLGPIKEPKFSLPITGATPSPDGKGFLLVSADGSVYAFGDAHFAGSCASSHTCPAQAVAIVAGPSGQGYWVVFAGCQLVAFGNVTKLSSGSCETYASKTAQHAVAAVPTPDGLGMWVLLRNGAIFALGDARLFGNWAPSPPISAVPSPAVALVPSRSGSGAWVVFADGAAQAYGAAPKLKQQGAGQVVPVAAAAGW
jgi:hypothetical protein